MGECGSGGWEGSDGEGGDVGMGVGKVVAVVMEEGEVVVLVWRRRKLWSRGEWHWKSI